MSKIILTGVQQSLMYLLISVIFRDWNHHSGNAT